MFQGTKNELLNQLSNEMKSFIQEKLELLMKEELFNHLHVEQPDIPNSRNGYYTRTLDTRYGRIDDLQVPRDRLGLFQTQVFEPYSRREGWLEEAIIQMYKAGMSTREVGQFVERIIGSQYSPTTISNLTNTVFEDVIAWQNRPLEKRYSVIYMDGTYVPLKRDTVEQEVIYIVMGIDIEGYRQILGFYVGGQESSTVWSEVIRDLKRRGVQEILLGVSDGLVGLKDSFLSEFPKADYQLCFVHKQRSSALQVRVSDRNAFLQDTKLIHEAQTYEEAWVNFENFKQRWRKKYPKVIGNWERDIHDLLTYYKYPAMIRAQIYTTNVIERVMKELKKRIRPMNSLANQDAAEKIVYLKAQDLNETWANHATRGFADETTKKSLLEMFDQRYSSNN